MTPREILGGAHVDKFHAAIMECCRLLEIDLGRAGDLVFAIVLAELPAVLYDLANLFWPVKGLADVL